MNYNTHTALVLASLFPAAVPMHDYIVEQTANGDVVISHWGTSMGPRPTPAEVDAAYPAALAAAQRAATPPVSVRQMHTALHRSGLLAPIKAFIAASGDVELEIAFASPTFERSNPMIAAVALAMGKTDSEVDAIFALAASV